MRYLPQAQQAIIPIRYKTYGNGNNSQRNRRGATDYRQQPSDQDNKGNNKARTLRAYGLADRRAYDKPKRHKT